MVVVNEHEQKCITFLTALQDCYRNEEDRELNFVGKIEIRGNSLTDDFIAMIQAMYALYVQFTGDKEIDLLGFTHILNRLVFQNAMKEAFVEVEDEKESEIED